MESFRQIKNNNVDLISNNDPLDKNRLLIEDLWESVLREECPNDQAERLIQLKELSYSKQIDGDSSKTFKNEINAAKDSLNSELIHWKDGKKVVCREWIQNLLSDLSSTADNFGIKHLLDPIYKVLEEGNQSMKWINQYEKGLSIEQIMRISIEDMIKIEDENV